MTRRRPGVNVTHVCAARAEGQVVGSKGEERGSFLRAVTRPAPADAYLRRSSRRHAFSRRPLQPCPRDNPCPICTRVPWAEGVSGCDPLDIRGRSRLPLEWYADEDIPEDNPCQCGAPVGGYHHWPCDIEVCPWADEHPDDGEQLLCCGCIE